MDGRTRRRIEEESIVLLRNSSNTLPLKTNLQSIAIIGSHADVGVLSGGGSAQVDSPGGDATALGKQTKWGEPVYFPSSPLRYIQEKAPGAKITFADGMDNDAAAKLAKASQLAIVFVNQPMSEGKDAETLSLPKNQDALVEAVAAANPNTIVVLETGGPVSDANRTVHFTVRNTGACEGTEIAEVYVALPSAAKENYKPPRRRGSSVKLAPGPIQGSNSSLASLTLNVFNTDQNGWQLLPGDYNVMAGPSSSDTPLKATLRS